MVTNVPLDDDLVKELELRAGQEGVSLTQFLEGVLRRELNGAPPVQETYAMREARIPLDKISDVLAELEVEDYLRKSRPQ